MLGGRTLWGAWKHHAVAAKQAPLNRGVAASFARHKPCAPFGAAQSILLARSFAASSASLRSSTVAAALVRVPTNRRGPIMSGARRLCSQNAQTSRNTGSQKSSDPGRSMENKNTSILLYLASIVVVGVGISYAAVPLYKIFCQVTGFGGTTQEASAEMARQMRPVPGASPITVQFVANTADTLPWTFKAQQREIKVVPGEPALAFYTAANNADEPIVGVSSYHVSPPKAGIFFHKVQCFCFDRQRLPAAKDGKPSSVDMPLLFYIDPAWCDDPSMAGVNKIVLSYTFFKAK